MTFNFSIKELDDLGEQFHTWKRNNPCRYVPKEYWDEALKFITKYDLEDIAQAIGYAPSYVLYKQKKKQSVTTSKIEFVEIQPSQTEFNLNNTRVHIQNHQGIAVELSFHGGIEQVFPLIYTLFKEEKLCSK